MELHYTYTPVDDAIPPPDFATAGSSGFDLRAQESGQILPGRYAIIPTGLKFSVPQGYEIQVRPRSGLAAKQGVTVLNTPGTIDADYRGEIRVILINHESTAFSFTVGDRIAQAVVCPVKQPKLVRVDELDTTARGEGRFGSTGVK